jgi:hypothetical protein
MNHFSFFSQTYWCDSLSEELEIWYDNIEHEPENGINWEFEWEAIDDNGKDRKDEMSAKEYNEVEKTIKDYVSDPANRDDDY